MFDVANAVDMQFERWMKNKVAINGKMWNTYLQKFKQKHFNDIRMLEYLDTETLEQLVSNRMHLKIFQIQIKNFQADMLDFSDWLKQIGVYNEYRTAFEKSGILTFEAFYFYVSNAKDIEKIIGTKNGSDAQYIWNKTTKCSRHKGDPPEPGKVYQREGNKAHNAMCNRY